MNQPVASTPAPTQAPANPQLLEQYKAKLTDLGNLGTRQTAMTTYYVSILSALLGVLAFKDRPLAAVDPIIVLAVCVPGILVSILWFTGVSFFRTLFRAKIRVLEELEKSLPAQTFKTEFAMMKEGGRSSWLYFERLVPVVFAVVFAGIVVSRFWRPVLRIANCLGG
jgi:hypothetical protein